MFSIVKRGFDFCFAAFLLVLSSPFLLLAALLVKLDSPGNIFYTQRRVGKDGKIFNLYKFRSMCENADSLKKDLQILNERDGPVFKIENDPRITSFGKLIRKYAIDEMPQILNILKGDMSFVGPRPPTVEEVLQYDDYDLLRLQAIPGLTCLWQIDPQKDEMKFKDWVFLDLVYISQQSFLNDMLLIFKTVPYIAFGRHKA